MEYPLFDQVTANVHGFRAGQDISNKMQIRTWDK